MYLDYHVADDAYDGQMAGYSAEYHHHCSIMIK